MYFPRIILQKPCCLAISLVLSFCSIPQGYASISIHFMLINLGSHWTSFLWILVSMLRPCSLSTQNHLCHSGQRERKRQKPTSLLYSSNMQPSEYFYHLQICSHVCNLKIQDIKCRLWGGEALFSIHFSSFESYCLCSSADTPLLSTKLSSACLRNSLTRLYPGGLFSMLRLSVC